MTALSSPCPRPETRGTSEPRRQAPVYVYAPDAGECVARIYDLVPRALLVGPARIGGDEK